MPLQQAVAVWDLTISVMLWSDWRTPLPAPIQARCYCGCLQGQAVTLQHVSRILLLGRAFYYDPIAPLCGAART